LRTDCTTPQGQAVPGGDQVDGGPHQADPHHAAVGDQPAEILVLEPLQASPQSHVGIGGFLGLHADQVLDSLGDRQLVSVQQELPLQQGTVQRAVGKHRARLCQSWPVSITWDQVRAWRLSGQHLDRRVPKKRLLDVVRGICGVHAQVQSSAELQLWARVNGVSTEEIREALWQERTLVRTWAMRGTLHLLTADDLPVYVAALRQHDRWWKGAWLRMIGMTEKELRATLDIIRASLGARPLTREQLADRVASEVGPKGRDRLLSGWGEMLKPAAFHGYLCSGPPRGQSVTFVRPDRWLGAWKVPDHDDAWREIVRRYLRTYGPASREEFARWWGMQPAPAGRVLKALAEELAEVDIEGHRAWAMAEDVSALRATRLRATVRLLPGFDVYVTGTRPRESLVAPRFKDRVFRQAGWISPVVLVDGMVAGVWRHERNGRRIDVTVELFGKLGSAHGKAITEEADRLGRFLDAPTALSFARGKR
jgi:hypothetical protein